MGIFPNTYLKSKVIERRWKQNIFCVQNKTEKLVLQFMWPMKVQLMTEICSKISLIFLLSNGIAVRI